MPGPMSLLALATRAVARDDDLMRSPAYAAMPSECRDIVAAWDAFRRPHYEGWPSACFESWLGTRFEDWLGAADPRPVAELVVWYIGAVDAMRSSAPPTPAWLSYAPPETLQHWATALGCKPGALGDIFATDMRTRALAGMCAAGAVPPPALAAALQSADVDVAMTAACTAGHLVAVRWLIENAGIVSGVAIPYLGPVCGVHRSTLESELPGVCARGHLDIAQLLVESLCDTSEHGVLDGLLWRACCDAVVAAVRGDHMSVAQWVAHRVGLDRETAVRLAPQCASSVSYNPVRARSRALHWFICEYDLTSDNFARDSADSLLRLASADGLLEVTRWLDLRFDAPRDALGDALRYRVIDQCIAALVEDGGALGDAPGDALGDALHYRVIDQCIAALVEDGRDDDAVSLVARRTAARGSGSLSEILTLVADCRSRLAAVRARLAARRAPPPRGGGARDTAWRAAAVRQGPAVAGRHKRAR